ncbi:MAG: hypothetical protein LBU66_08270 [Treponema sp.]|jgi:hypothetical protein|nr:hypothetical protein [Treponema sp.]
MKRLLIFTILIFSTTLIFSADFGLLHNQKIEAVNDEFIYNPDFTPWFSLNNKQGLSLYLSALLSLKIDDTENPVFIPELTRFALTYGFGNQMSVEAGRIVYSDILGINALGYFDGVRFNWNNLNAAFFYTGLLYKDTAKIMMSDEDTEKFAEPWNYDSFDGYFASRRAIAALSYTYPLTEGSSLSAELLCQFDLNDSRQTIHSQYGTLLFDIIPTDILRITAGAIFETMQKTDIDFSFASGNMIRAQLILPTPINDLLGLTVKSSTGSNDGNTDGNTEIAGGFIPITSVTQGDIFPGTIAGLAVISLDYEARLLPSLFAECAFRYFIRTYDNEMSPGNFYGAEVWANAAWQPFDDLRFNLSGGAFFPGLGDIDVFGSDVMWKFSAGLSISF